MNKLEELIDRYPVLSDCKESILNAYELLVDSYENNGKLLACGNGGSCSDCEHIVGELMKGFKLSRPISENLKNKLSSYSEQGEKIANHLQEGLPAINLSNHMSLNTAFSNDVNHEFVVAQQVNVYGNEQDIFLGITTSGNSTNIVNAALTAKAKGMKVIALTGRDGGEISKLADVSIIVPEYETYKIQELHLPIYHCICLMLEEYFFI